MILNYILLKSATHSVYQKDIEEEFGLRSSTATGALKELSGRMLQNLDNAQKDIG